MELKEVQQFTEKLLKEYQQEYGRTKSDFDQGAAIALETVLEFMGTHPEPKTVDLAIEAQKGPTSVSPRNANLAKARFNRGPKFSFFRHLLVAPR